MKPKMIEIRSCGKTFEMSVRDLTDWQLDRLLEQNADRAAIDPAEIDLLRKEQAWRREAASLHTFTDTNRPWSRCRTASPSLAGAATPTSPPSPAAYSGR